MPQLHEFKRGMKVKVVRDYEDPEPDSPWIGAVGVVARITDWCVVVRIAAGNPEPDGGNFAWFTHEELEVCPS